MRTLLTIILICLASVAFAGNHPDEVTILKLEHSQIRQVEPGRSIVPEVVLGNLNEPVNEMADWAYGNEAYTYAIAPEQLDICGREFAPLSVVFYMSFSEADLPITFPIQGALRGFELDASGNKIPGDRILATPTYEVALSEAGAYEFIVPFAEEDLTCVSGEGPWYAELYLPVSFPDNQFPSILADANPVPGISWYNYFLLGWEDLVATYSWTGGAVVRIEAACCDGTVATESRTMGGLKSLYR